MGLRYLSGYEPFRVQWRRRCYKEQFSSDVISSERERGSEREKWMGGRVGGWMDERSLTWG